MNIESNVKWQPLWLELVDSFTLCLMLLPAWLLVDTYASPRSLQHLWMGGLVALSILGTLLGKVLNTLWTRLLASTVLGGVFLLLLSVGGEPLSGLLLLAASACVLTMLAMSATSTRDKLRVYSAGLGLYFICSISFSRTPVLEGLVPLLGWGGVVCLIIFLLRLNAHQLRKASFSGEGPSKASPEVMRRNRGYLAILFGAAAILAVGWGSLMGQGFLWLIRQIFGFLFSDSPGPEKIPEMPAEHAPQAPPEFVPQEGPGWIGRILNELFFVIGYVAIAALIVFGIYSIYRYGGPALRMKWSALLNILRQNRWKAEAPGYVDEESRVGRSDKTRKRQFRLPLRGKEAEYSDWERMSNRQRARLLYRSWLTRQRQAGYVPKASLTPAEILRDEARTTSASKSKISTSREVEQTLVDLYYRTRYGEESPEDTEMMALRERLFRRNSE